MKNKFDFEFNPVYYNMCNISNGRDPMASHPFFHKNIASVVQCSAVVLSSALLVSNILVLNCTESEVKGSHL